MHMNEEKKYSEFEINLTCKGDESEDISEIEPLRSYACIKMKCQFLNKKKSFRIQFHTKRIVNIFLLFFILKRKLKFQMKTDQ